ncbi:hypothetical protein HYS28_03805 [Candidatus Uhrbacteria bacterium]|nr:hypothetical protein [Candidatus Uhrbacteria bacterium]
MDCPHPRCKLKTHIYDSLGAHHSGDDVYQIVKCQHCGGQIKVFTMLKGMFVPADKLVGEKFNETVRRKEWTR